MVQGAGGQSPQRTPGGFSLNGTGSSLWQFLSSQPSLVRWLPAPPQQELWAPRPPGRFSPSPRSLQGRERASGQQRRCRRRSCSMAEVGLFVPSERGSGEMVEPEAPASEPATRLQLPR